MEQLGEDLIGSRWKHFKGGCYEIIAVALDCENPNRIMVVYRGENGVVWVRSLEDWHSYVARDEYTGPRFVRLRDTE